MISTAAKMSIGFGPGTFNDLFVWVRAKGYEQDRNFQRFHHTCGFRRCRPGIPIEAGHLFRSKSATHSGDVGHPSGLVLSCRRG